jgi:hypothetical protein
MKNKCKNCSDLLTYLVTTEAGWLLMGEGAFVGHCHEIRKLRNPPSQDVVTSSELKETLTRDILPLFFPSKNIH